MSFKIAIHGVPDTDYSIITVLKSRMFGIFKLLVACPAISPRLMNWKERFSGTRDVRHLKAKIAFLKDK